MNDIQPSTPIERAAYIMAKLSAGQKLSTAKVAVANVTLACVCYIRLMGHRLM